VMEGLASMQWMSRNKREFYPRGLHPGGNIHNTWVHIAGFNIAKKHANILPILGGRGVFWGRGWGVYKEKGLGGEDLGIGRGFNKRHLGQYLEKLGVFSNIL